MILFDQISVVVLENDPSVIFALDSSLRLVYCNPAWDRFAVANGGAALVRPAPIGKPLLGFIKEPLAAYYETAYQEVLRTLEPWRHLYECSSPSTFRRFAMQVLPMKGHGLLVVNSLCVERPHDSAPDWSCEAAYRRDDGILVMCSHCRRTRRVGALEHWDWVAHYVRELPPRTSHGLCPSCLEYYYPDGV
ncbi:MAG: PAS domain-containing protein [Acidobacteriia bacterium]|nr:PAS domain-containing protein [Terriglobia bacterium]